MNSGQKPRNLGASVRVRLTNLAREQKLEFQLVLSERAFLRRGRLAGPEDALDLSAGLRQFLTPILGALSLGDEFEGNWPAGGPWTE